MSEDKKIIEQLKGELEKANKEAQEYLNGWKRAKADYINRENELKKEKDDWIKFANKNLILEILHVYDNLKKAAKQIQDAESKMQDIKIEKLFEGIINIKKQFENILKKFGIEEIKAVGERFDPELHEAVAPTRNDQGKEQVEIKEEIIKEEVEPGYKLHNKVIKPAKVIVG